MGLIKTGEPAHWHKHDQSKHAEHWSHNMTDPRALGDDWPQKFWTPDERAFVRHLEEHEAREKSPERSASDTEAISALFDAIEADERKIIKMKQMVTALRQQESAKNSQPDAER